MRGVERLATLNQLSNLTVVNQNAALQNTAAELLVPCERSCREPYIVIAKGIHRSNHTRPPRGLVRSPSLSHTPSLFLPPSLFPFRSLSLAVGPLAFPPTAFALCVVYLRYCSPSPRPMLLLLPLLPAVPLKSLCLAMPCSQPVWSTLVRTNRARHGVCVCGFAGREDEAWSPRRFG